MRIQKSLKHLSCFLSIILLTSNSNSFAQKDNGIGKLFRDSSQLFGNCVADDESVFHFVTIPPSFKGDFKKFISSEIDTGKIRISNEGQKVQTDSALIKFLVTIKGDLCRFKFLNNPNPYLRQLMMRIFLHSPNWYPGTNDGGRMLNVYSQLLITFKTNPGTKFIQIEVVPIRNKIL